MSATNTIETGLLELILNNVDLANIGDATGLRGSSTAGSLYISLHTSDPGETGNQTTNECAYTSYARVAVTRSTVIKQWTVTTGSAVNANQIQFPKATGGSETATHFGIGYASSGTGNLILSGALTSSVAISNNIQPTFAAGAITVTCD